MTQHDRILHLNFDQLVINPKYEEAVIQPTKEQDDDFDQSVKENGIREPLKVNIKNVVLDGHRRYRKAKKYDIKTLPVIVETFNTEDEEYDYVLKVNFERRNLNETQRIIAAIKIRDFERIKAKKRQGKKTSSSNEQKGGSRDIAAKKAHVSSTKLFKVEHVMNSGNSEIIEDMINEKKSVARAYNLINQKERKFNDVDLPKQKSHIVLADLPLKWSHEERGSATEHYETMPPAEYLLKHPVDEMPFADDCILFIWSWSGMKKDIEYIVEEWGFEIESECIWIKTNKEGGTGGGSNDNYRDLSFGMGSVFRSCHETLLYCTKGKDTLPNPENRVRSAFLSPKLEHSEKPDFVYEIIDKMFPEDQKLELYARGEKSRKNWIFHGNELKIDTGARKCTKEEDFEANCHSWSSPEIETEEKPTKCPECGELKTEFELNSYGKKCTDCYDMLRIMVKSNKGIMTAEVYDEFQKEYGSKRKKSKVSK